MENGGDSGRVHRSRPQGRGPKEARAFNGEVQQVRSSAEIAARWERINRLVAEINALAVLDPRSTEEIVGDIDAL